MLRPDPPMFRYRFFASLTRQFAGLHCKRTDLPRFDPPLSWWPGCMIAIFPGFDSVRFFCWLEFPRWLVTFFDEVVHAFLDRPMNVRTDPAAATRQEAMARFPRTTRT